MALGVACALVSAAMQRALEVRLMAQQDQARFIEERAIQNLEAWQRPVALNCGVGTPDVDPPPLRLDEFGNLKDPFGSEARPFYLYWDHLRVVPASGNQSTGTLQARIGSDTPLALHATAPGPPRFDIKRSDIAKHEKGGLVKIDIEVQLDAAAKTGALVTSLFVVVENPWTIVINESGPVDPRFKNPPAAVYVHCDPAFRYAPTKPELAGVNAPLPILKHARPFIATPQNVTANYQLPVKPAVITTAQWSNLQTDAENQQSDLVIERQGTAIAVTSLTREKKPGFRQPRARNNGETIFEVALDRTGVSTWQYLNRRRPPLLAFFTDAFLQFSNELSDRQFVVTFSAIPEPNRAELVRQGLKVSDCRDAKCKASVQVSARGQVRVPLRGLRDALAKNDTGGAVSFTVSFFDDDITPSNNTGYFTFVDEQNFRESGSVAIWSSGVTVAMQRDPDLSTFVPPGTKTPAINFGAPLGRINRAHVTGSATIGLKQQLGSRADAEIELVAKKGDFGLEPSGVSASKYFATIYALSGATLTGGRFDLAAPTNSIALTESGEAVNLAFRVQGMGRVNVGRIVRKELPDGSFTAAEAVKAAAAGNVLEKDHGAYVLQVRDMTFNTKLFRTSLFGVLGEAKRGHITDPANPATSALIPYEIGYWTTGADMVFSYKHVLLTGGFYRNKRWSDDAPEAASTGIAKSGNVGLLTLSYTNIDKEDAAQGKQTVDWVVSGSFGVGGNYVGETQSFAPDQLFLTTFAPALREAQFPIGTGLTNKVYIGAAVTTPQSWDLLKKIIGPLTPTARDISASSVTLKVHRYILRNTGATNRTLGTEGNFEFRIESPKGVRFQWLLAAFKPDEALTAPAPSHSLITKWQYSTKFGVTIRLE